LFNPDGKPIRAICKVTIRQVTDEEQRVLEENNSSPDLTHFRVVKKGDTLPLMCFKIYGDSKYYLQVAAVNKLSNFRNLSTGTEIFFPPFDKTKS
jgi:nucleoid-associated protein YgaU